MSENKKYYYLKFKENYFEQDHIKVIEAMKNGYEYSLIILKLYLKSLKYNGQLMINERIPYDKNKIEILAGVLGHNPAEVMHAINLAKEMGIMEIYSTGQLFMADIQNFIGLSSTEGDRKKAYRNKLDALKRGQITDKCPRNCPPEIELDIEKDIDIYYQNQYFVITKQQYEEYKKTYKIDIDNELNKMKIWLDANPANRKKNYPRFINSWFNRAVNNKNQQSAQQSADLGYYQGKKIIKQERTEQDGKQYWKLTFEHGSPLAILVDRFEELRNKKGV